MKLTKNKIKAIFIYFSSLIIVLSIFSSADIYSFEKHFYNSDTLYLPSLYEDIFIKHNNISNFHLNPAPNFFPDMPAHFFLMKVFNSNFSLTALLFASFQIFFLIFLLKKIGNKMSSNNKTVINIGLYLLMLFSIPSIYEDNFLFTFYFIINSYHLGSFIISLLLILLVYEDLYDIKNRKSLITIITFITYISDKSIVINFIAPMIILLLILIIKGKLVRKQGFLMLGSILLGSSLGILFLTTVEKLDLLIIPSDGVSIELSKIKISFLYFIEHTIIYLKEFSFISLLILISFTSYILNIILIIRERKQLPFLDLYFLLLSTIIIVSPILSGKITGLDSIRYNYHSLIVLTFLFPYFLHKIFKLKIVKNNLKIELITFSPLFILICINFNYTNLIDKINLYPNEIKLIDINQEKYGLKNGLSTYWKSKKNTMFSKKNIKIRCVHEDLKPHMHVTNEDWYFTKKNRLVYNFIIIDNQTMLNNVLSKFDSVKLEQISDDLLIAKTEEFVINESFNFVKRSYKEPDTSGD